MTAQGERSTDLTGRTFGKWTVLGRTDPPRRHDSLMGVGAYWLCQCSCDMKTRSAIRGTALRSGRSTQCKSCATRAQRERQKGSPAMDGTSHTRIEALPAGIAIEETAHNGSVFLTFTRPGGRVPEPVVDLEIMPDGAIVVGHWPVQDMWTHLRTFAPGEF